MEIKKLTNEFYEKYKDCNQILQKKDRPYIHNLIEIDGILFAIPFKSEIDHSFKMTLNHSDPEKKNNGLDFLKAIPILDESYVEKKGCIIDSKEHNDLKSKHHLIKVRYLKFLKEYKKALDNPSIKRNYKLLNHCALIHFKEVIEKKCLV